VYDDLLHRPEWMRPPSWRWLASESFLADPTKDVDEVMADPIIYEAARFKRLLKTQPDRPAHQWREYKDVSAAFQMYLNSVNDGWRWILEAYLMTGLDDKEISERLKVDITPSIVKRYRGLFFDISPYRDSKQAVTANLLSTSKVRVGATGVSDYTWKVFAYVWGPDAFEEAFFPSKEKMQNIYTEWLRINTSQSLDSAAFHLASDMRTAYNESAMSIIETARHYWDIPDSSTDSLADQAKKDFLDSLSRSIHMAVISAPPKDEEFKEGGDNAFERKE
jgi:hypothetical protein